MEQYLARDILHGLLVMILMDTLRMIIVLLGLLLVLEVQVIQVALLYNILIRFLTP